MTDEEKKHKAYLEHQYNLISRIEPPKIQNYAMCACGTNTQTDQSDLCKELNRSNQLTK